MAEDITEHDPCQRIKARSKSLGSPVTASVYKKLLADPHNTPIDAARLRAVASEHAGDWLHAAPITAVGLRLSDEAITVAVGHRLGSTTANPTHVFVVCRWMLKAYMDSPAGKVLPVKFVTHS